MSSGLPLTMHCMSPVTYVLPLFVEHCVQEFPSLFLGIFYCFDEEPDAFIFSEYYKVVRSNEHNDGAHDNTLSREHFLARHSVRMDL